MGEWAVESSLNRISRNDVTVRLEHRAMDVLIFLVEMVGQVVTPRELQDAVWQTGFVSYNTVTGRIHELRAAFEDDARRPRYIETIPKMGYRLIAPVHDLPASSCTQRRHGELRPREKTPESDSQPVGHCAVAATTRRIGRSIRRMQHRWTSSSSARSCRASRRCAHRAPSRPSMRR